MAVALDMAVGRGVKVGIRVTHRGGRGPKRDASLGLGVGVSKGGAIGAAGAQVTAVSNKIAQMVRTGRTFSIKPLCVPG